MQASQDFQGFPQFFTGKYGQAGSCHISQNDNVPFYKQVMKT
jgi:hypothetical protein